MPGNRRDFFELLFSLNPDFRSKCPSEMFSKIGNEIVIVDSGKHLHGYDVKCWFPPDRSTFILVSPAFASVSNRSFMDWNNSYVIKDERLFGRGEPLLSDFFHEIKNNEEIEYPTIALPLLIFDPAFPNIHPFKAVGVLATNPKHFRAIKDFIFDFNIPKNYSRATYYE